MVRKVATWLLVAFVVLSMVYQLFDMYKFINSGARFTLADGQRLCARVQRLEARIDLTPENCGFGKEIDR